MEIIDTLTKPFLNTISVARDLSSVTTYDPSQEVDPESVGISQKGANTIWSNIENLYRTGVYPAITFCLRRRGEIVFNRAIGHARGNGPGDALHTPKLLAQPNTPICIFSSSKAATAMLVHKLVEQGKINLLDPVSHYIPEFAANKKDRITIFQVLAHRSAIPKIPEGVSVETLADPDAVVHILCETSTTLREGREQAYHAVTGGYIVGELIKRVTGSGIQDYWRQHVKEPMAMRFFDYGIEAEDWDKIALNYMTGPKIIFPINRYAQHLLGMNLGRIVELSNERQFYESPIPAANMTATAEEVSRFFQMILDQGKWDGRQIFDPLTIHRATLEVSEAKFDKSFLIPMRYSAGLMLGGSPIGIYGPDTDQAYGHIGLSNILNWADPQRDISVALLTTGKPVVAHHGPAIAMALRAISKHCPSIDA